MDKNDPLYPMFIELRAAITSDLRVALEKAPRDNLEEFLRMTIEALTQSIKSLEAP